MGRTISARPTFSNLPRSPALPKELEQELEAELHVPLGSRQRAGHFAEIGIAVAAVRETELCSVEDVEELTSELQSKTLGERKVLEYGKVQILERRSGV